MAVVPSLPQELIDLIIDTIYLAYGTAPLKKISTVSKAWLMHSQKHIFREFTLTSKRMKRIYSYYGARGAAHTADNMPGQQFPNMFSYYVQELHIRMLEFTPSKAGRKYLKILPFFTGVTSLKIVYGDFRKSERDDVNRFLGRFGKTVTELKLLDCYFDSSVLVSLTSLFHHIDNLWVRPRVSLNCQSYKIQNSDRSGSVEFRRRLVFKCSLNHRPLL